MAVPDCIDDLREALDAALDADCGDAQGAELSETVPALTELRAKLDALTAEVTSAWVRSGDWSLTSRTPKVWLKANCAMKAASAGRQIRHARLLESMPLTAEVLRAGRITDAHVARLARANSGRTAARFAEAEELLVGYALTLEYIDFDQRVTYWEQVVDPDGAEADAIDEDGGDWFATTGLAGRTEAGGTLPPLGGKEYRDELERLTRIEHDADWVEARDRLGDAATQADLRRSAGARRAAAQIHMARRSGNYGPRRAPAAKRVVNIVCDHGTARAQTALLWGQPGHEVRFPHDRTCELEDGTVLTPSQAIDPEAVADLWFRRLVFGPRSYDVDLGHERRFFTGPAREAVILRDQRCFAPGCDIPARQCHIDHIVEHERGGPTTPANGQAACPSDNLRKEHARHRFGREPPD